MRAFRGLPDEDIAAFVKAFSKAVTDRLTECPAFEPLLAPALDRAPIAPTNHWDRFATIFPFLLLRSDAFGRRTWLKPSETKEVHERLRDDLCNTTSTVSSLRCQVGQPVACGTREGVPVSALRLCVSARLIVDAIAPGGRGSDAVIAEAMSVLDKAALLASLSHA